MKNKEFLIIGSMTCPSVLRCKQDKVRLAKDKGDMMMKMVNIIMIKHSEKIICIKDLEVLWWKSLMMKINNQLQLIYWRFENSD